MDEAEIFEITTRFLFWDRMVSELRNPCEKGRLGSLNFPFYKSGKGRIKSRFFFR